MRVTIALVDDWLPLLVSIVGVVGTLAASLLTQRAADRRDVAHWERERERDRDERDRRQAEVSLERRQAAYIGFLVECRRICDHYDFKNSSIDPYDYLRPLWANLEIVDVYGSRRASELAHEAAIFLRVALFTSHSFEKAEGGIDALREHIRGELGVGD